MVPQSLALDELTLETEDKWKILSKLKTWGLVRRLRREQRTEESRQLVWPEHQETGAQMRDQAGVAGATQFKDESQSVCWFNEVRNKTRAC